MLNFVNRVDRDRDADIHETELSTTLIHAYDAASNYLERKFPTQKRIDTVRIDWIGPDFSMTKRRLVHLGENKDMVVRLGKEKGWIYRLSRSKPDVMIECFYTSAPLPAKSRTEQYILSYDGSLRLRNFDLQKIDWPSIPNEDYAKRVQLVHEAVNAVLYPPIPPSGGVSGG